MFPGNQITIGGPFVVMNINEFILSERHCVLYPPLFMRRYVIYKNDYVRTDPGRITTQHLADTYMWSIT